MVIKFSDRCTYARAVPIQMPQGAWLHSQFSHDGQFHFMTVRCLHFISWLLQHECRYAASSNTAAPSNIFVSSLFLDVVMADARVCCGYRQGVR
jgi:hypothetical protein